MISGSQISTEPIIDLTYSSPERTQTAHVAVANYRPIHVADTDTARWISCTCILALQ